MPSSPPRGRSSWEPPWASSSVLAIGSASATVTSSYVYLTAAEQDTFDEYTRLRQLSDWPDFGDDQAQRKSDARAWIDARRSELWHDLHSEPVDEQANKANHRQERYDYLAPDNLASGSPHNLCQLPTEYATNSEGVHISEREVWWNIQTDYAEQKARKQACTDWLIERRKYVWQLAEGKVEGEKPGWDVADRNERYANLCIATRYGSSYDDWCEEYDEYTGQPRGDWRDASASWHNAHLGITEDPSGSNCDSRSDGIRNSQDKTAGGTWLRYQPWCGCWAFMGLYAAGLVSADGSYSFMASVASIEDAARAGSYPFIGWTTNGEQARKGDLVVLFGRGQHVGTVRDIDSSYAYTWEGNTSSGSSGSQSNGGGSYKRQRSRASEVYGYALVAD